MQQLTCSECRFWDGLCHAHPPVIVPNAGYGENGDYQSHYQVLPQTDGDFWCGEFEPKSLPKPEKEGPAPAAQKAPMRRKR